MSKKWDPKISTTGHLIRVKRKDCSARLKMAIVLSTRTSTRSTALRIITTRIITTKNHTISSLEFVVASGDPTISTKNLTCRNSLLRTVK